MIEKASDSPALVYFFQMQLKTNDRGYVTLRESQTLEFKQTFHYGDALLEYARSLVAMANNQGGKLVFGVKDKPHEILGIDDRIERFDPKNLNKVFLEYFSADIDWELETFKQSGKSLAVIKVKEASCKPVICMKHHDKKHLREGAVYFRYRGETKEIRFAELNSMLQQEKDKEKALWMKHITSIAKIGPQAVQILDSSGGEMEVGGSKVVLDRNLLGKLKLIKEGEFSEVNGAPTLRLIGDIEGLIDHDHVVYTEKSYPYTQTTILEKLPLTVYQFQAFLWKFSIKGDSKFHAEIATGKTGTVHKYSERLVPFITDKIRANPKIAEEITPQFSASRSKNRR